MDFLNSTQKQQLDTFKKSLLKINKKINLISRRNPEKQIEILIKNSLVAGQNLQKFFKPPQKKILDIGSGNGFPVFLLAILFPHQKFYLCERKRKKATALEWMAYQMNLFCVKILCESAESLKADFDVLLSQASMPLEKLLPLSHKLLKKEGMAFFWLSKTEKALVFPGLKIKSLPSDSPSKILLKVQKKVSSS